MIKFNKKNKTFKFPLTLNAYRSEDHLHSNNQEVCSFFSSFLFKNAYNNGLIPTYFIADRDLIVFFILSFRNSRNNILNDLYAKRFNNQNKSTDKEILPKISGVLTFPENMKYSPILYFIEYCNVEKKIQFGIEINRTVLTFSNFNEIDLISEMTKGDKKYVELLLGFLLYKEVFLSSVKNGLLWNIPKFRDSRKRLISVLADKKIKEIFKKSSKAVSPCLKVGRYRKFTSEKLQRKYGHIIYIPSKR